MAGIKFGGNLAVTSKLPNLITHQIFRLYGIVFVEYTCTCTSDKIVNDNSFASNDKITKSFCVYIYAKENVILLPTRIEFVLSFAEISDQ